MIQLSANDHGKPMDVSKASARLTLLNGTEKQEVELKPGAGTKAVAVVTNAGKTLGTAHPSARRHGHARTLMRFLIKHFGEQAMHRLTLETATTNVSAQVLYESLGYERDRVFITYHRPL